MHTLTHEITYMQGSVFGHLSRANVFRIHSMVNLSSEMVIEWESDDCISVADPLLSGGWPLLIPPPGSFPSWASDL